MFENRQRVSTDYELLILLIDMRNTCVLLYLCYVCVCCDLAEYMAESLVELLVEVNSDVFVLYTFKEEEECEWCMYVYVLYTFVKEGECVVYVCL